MPLAVQVGRRIKKARVHFGYTQDELASKCGVSALTRVSEWERGIHMPRLEHLHTMHKVLRNRRERIRLDWLITGSGPMTTM